ncbi:GNAT family N-acetyltransferase [Streptomyces monticola]|uniref:GNAT family N-acetyltransferase n=1 Tax=Streptomyces monticola TaxID=2666263 RepID=A0ABW2JDI3_9ACTN
MERVVSYLEMTDEAQLRPAAPVPDLSLRRLESDAPLVREVHARVGDPYGWQESTRTAAQWETHFRDHPLRQYWIVVHGAEPAGVAYLEPQQGGDVEVTAFGLLPEYVGKGLGGYALTLSLRQAWATRPVGAEAVRRVWLHTDTRDHPHALANYEKRGLRAYRREAK